MNNLNNLKVEISKENRSFKGFTIKEGFVLFTDSEGSIVAISSGWYNNRFMFTYTLQNGEWIGRWEDEDDFPIFEAMDAIFEYEYEKEMEEAKMEVANLLADGEKLFVSKEKIRFTDVYPGEKSRNGGEYGFYSTYYPTEVEGIYEYYTSTTCEIDACGTGYEGIEILTEDKYNYLLEEERKVLEEEF